VTSDRDHSEQATPGEVPRETVSGDRVCMQCLHPLAGSAVVREPATGLLYCRCVECGTAAALLEYPTITPWIRRMKSVAAAFFVTMALLATLAAVGIGGLFPTIATEAADESANALVEAYRAQGGTTRDQSQQFDSGRFAVADQAWLASDEGRAALRASRLSPGALIPFLGFAALGSAMLVPTMLLLGLAGMRRHPLVRAAIGGLVPSIGGVLATAGVFAVMPLGMGLPQNMTWTNYAAVENGPFFSGLMLGWLACVGAFTALVTPPLAAAIFRFILPPHDRRLVAWIWEWRGKPIPRD
jgi:hypothetical protein